MLGQIEKTNIANAIVKKQWVTKNAPIKLDLLAKGKAIDYEGATAVKFTDVGEHVGNFIEKEIKGGKFKNKKQR